MVCRVFPTAAWLITNLVAKTHIYYPTDPWVENPGTFAESSTQGLTKLQSMCPLNSGRGTQAPLLSSFRSLAGIQFLASGRTKTLSS